MFENEIEQASDKFTSLETEHAIIEFVNKVSERRSIGLRDIYLRLMTTLYINKGNYSDEVFAILSEYYEKDEPLANCLMVDYQTVIEYLLYEIAQNEHQLGVLPADIAGMCHSIFGHGTHTYYNAWGSLSALMYDVVSTRSHIETAKTEDWAIMQIYQDSIGQKLEIHLAKSYDDMVSADEEYSNAFVIEPDSILSSAFESYIDRLFDKLMSNGMLMLIVTDLWFFDIGNRLSKKMIDAIDTVIEIPDTGSCILIFIKSKKDRIQFVNAFPSNPCAGYLEYIVDYDTILEAIMNVDPEICRMVDKKDINWNGSIRPRFFFRDLNGIKNPVRLGDLIERFEEIVSIDSIAGEDIYQVDQLSDNWLFSEVNMTSAREFGRIYRINRPALYLLEYRDRLLMGHSTGCMLDYVSIHGDIEAFYVKDESKVSVEYLLYALSQPFVSKQVATMYRDEHLGIVPLSEYLDLTISLPETLEEQERELNQAKTTLLEQRGFVQHSADIAHMLSTPMTKIGVELELLSLSNSLSEADKRGLASAKSILSYMNRLLSQSSGDLFSEREKSPVCLSQFIQEYVDGWSHFGSNTFRVELNVVPEAKDGVVMANRDSLSILLDCLFDNANRHGFRKKADPANLLEVEISRVSFAESDCLRVEVRNNGHMMDPSITLSDYIARGRFSAESGRSGLGGHHVNKIIEAMQGQLLSVGSANGKTSIVFVVPVIKE